MNSSSFNESIYTEKTNSGFNKITIMLLCFLFMACCLICIAYKFNMSSMISSGVFYSACLILICFIIYIFWNHFYGAGSGNTEQMISEETKKLYSDRYLNAAKSASNMFSQMNLPMSTQYAQQKGIPPQQGILQTYPTPYNQNF